LKIPDPPIFLNDGNPIWEDWNTDMKIKLDCYPDGNEKETMGYVFSRTGGNPRALIQIKYLNDEYFTAEAIYSRPGRSLQRPQQGFQGISTLQQTPYERAKLL
jgi:hypothetical protein